MTTAMLQPRTKMYLPVPLFPQDYSHTCWAACLRSMACYYNVCVSENAIKDFSLNKPSGSCSNSPQECNKPQAPDVMRDTLKKITHFGWYVSPFSSNLNLIKNCIASNNAVILCLSNPHQSIGHAVVCAGFETYNDCYSNLGRVFPETFYYVLDPASSRGVLYNFSELQQRTTYVIHSNYQNTSSGTYIPSLVK